MTSRLTVVYGVRASAAEIKARAQAIAVEQSVEMPLSAIHDGSILSDIVGQVRAIDDRGNGTFDVTIDLAAATIGSDAGQLINMLFGNTSLHDDVVLSSAILPSEMLSAFGGPSHGLSGLRERVGAKGRAMTCSALKPQGLGAEDLGKLAFELTMGGLDFIKDDHGLADQSYSPFVDRVRACAAAVRKASERTGHPTRYAPSLSGSYADMERQLGLAREEGLDVALIAPMVAGPSNFNALRRNHPDFAFLAHPTMTGARVSPVLFAQLFRLFGADASIFPNYGGRFGYSLLTCKAIAAGLLESFGGLAASAPAPAGGMSLDRTPELLDCYGEDVMLLIGGGLLSAPREGLAAEAGRFVRAVADHCYPRMSTP
ncbi:RuBisCO large subunit C-terminal-like domain-containing protein [Methylocella tundrae]|uniref:RuBisCO large subunit C-terminal-like domain-containing protein n=1 Tax=Methylocella tundrae TaxID=227605 RepID=UPI0030FEE0AB|nr:RuBisCO large subunit C-terminal-like domain-containing protein [Methylocella tundrae]